MQREPLILSTTSSNEEVKNNKNTKDNTMVNTALLDKLKKNSTIEASDRMDQSEIFSDADSWTTDIPALNIALSGELDGAYNPGMLTIAGPSKHFKSLLGLLVAAAYMKKNPEAVMAFYDSEKGAALNYFTAAGVDPSRVLHSPITTVEELTHDAAAQMAELKRGDKVFFYVDSVGNLASAKEVKDAIEGSDKADMTRAKKLKSFGRIVTPHLVFKDLPMCIINHTYEELSMFPKQIMGGGTGIYYSSNDIWFMGRQQEKPTSGADKGKILGYHFIINIEKSRKVKEKSRIPITVLQEGGVNRFSGLLDVALETGYVTKPKNGYYTNEYVNDHFTEADTNTDDFWDDLLADDGFKEAVRDRYLLAGGKSLVGGK